MQPFGEVLIFAGVADETRIELDWRHCADESFHVHDERIWHTGVAQEDLRDLSFGFVDGIDADGGRPIVSNALKPLNCAQIKGCKDSAIYNRKINIHPEEVRPAEVRPDEVRRAEVRPDETCPGEVRPAEVRRGEVRV